MNVVDLDALEGQRVALSADEPRTVGLSLDAGEAVSPHSHPGRTIVCHVIEGELDVQLDGEPHRLTAGDVARFDGDREISPRAETDATALLVLTRT